MEVSIRAGGLSTSVEQAASNREMERERVSARADRWKGETYAILIAALGNAAVKIDNSRRALDAPQRIVQNRPPSRNLLPARVGKAVAGPQSVEQPGF
jgi:hypothetical protein